VANIVHHDIKPENLLVDSQDNLKYTDFGSALRLTENLGETSETYDWGTRIYHPPESWQRNLD
jgi:serine/threonine protein kinase